MRRIQALTILAMVMAACASNGTSLPPAIEDTETIAESSLETEIPTQRIDDTPVPPILAAPIVPSPDIIILHMINELNGWAISEDAILRTTDGGSTWYNLSPRGEEIFGYGVASAFLNDSQAWILVSEAGNPSGQGKLYRTNNGGLTWYPAPVPFSSLGHLYFVDEDHGWMMLDLGAGAGSMGIAILRTIDGGITWLETFSHEPGAGTRNDSIPLGGLKTDFVALDESIAWVGGVIYAPETFYFYKTIDGGGTWAAQSMTLPPGAQGNDIALESGPIFFSPKKAVLAFRFMGNNFHTVFYTTQDGGETWQYASMMPGAGSVDFVSASEGFFWTGEQFFATQDGAQTWTSINSEMLFGESFAGMDFVNARTGWVWTYEENGLRSLYKTTDGAKTWTSMEN